MTITNESQFQKWVMKELLPALFKIHDTIHVRDKSTHGISDLVVMTTEGIMAIELKFRKKEHVRGRGFFGSHRLTKLQHRFLCNWAKASRGYAFVLLGIQETDEIVLCDYSVFKDWDLRDVRVNDADNAVYVDGILGLSRDQIKKGVDLRALLQMMINPIWIGKDDG